MNKEEMMVIAQQVAEVIKEKGYAAEVAEINKNGVIQTGITIGEGKVRATIYPDYAMDVDEIVDYIISVYKENKPSDGQFNEVTEAFSDYEKIKGKIIPYLSSGYNPDAVSRLYLDLNVYYRAVFKNVSGIGDCSVVIKKEHLKAWDGITETDLYRQAKENVKDLFMIMDMSDIIPVPQMGYMKVVCLPDKTYGSSALLFPEIFEKENNGAPLIILPSSIHELIVIEDSGSTQGFADMIMEINQTQVKPDEVLSNHPYRYADGEITEV